MGSENSTWSTFKRNMKSFGEFDRHEDKLALGVPDVSYQMYHGASGWIELKYKERYPVRKHTIFKIEHFTREQKAWLRRRGSAGDNCWVFLQVARDYWLFDWQAAQYIGALTWAELAPLAVRGWENGCVWPELKHLLILPCVVKQ